MSWQTLSDNYIAQFGSLRKSFDACACMGPQGMEPLCPCAMKNVGVERIDGKWISRAGTVAEQVWEQDPNQSVPYEIQKTQEIVDIVKTHSMMDAVKMLRLQTKSSAQDALELARNIIAGTVTVEQLAIQLFGDSFLSQSW